MKTNTFYNPKNQYNELLASVPYVNAEDAAVDAKFTSEINRVDERINTEIEDREAADQNIHHKIETLNTIKVKWINAGRGDNKFSDIKEYFVSLIEPSSPYRKDIEELKVELGQTIYIIDGKDDSTTSLKTYEEWVCINPDFESHGEKYNNLNIPAMVRLGAVDSILAREESPGSVQLIHNLYNEEDWSKYFATDYEGNVTHRPIKGEAVAPCALKAFVEADKEIIGSLELEIAARKEAVEAEEAARIEEDTTIKARLDKIEAEIEGSTVEDEIGFQDSRLDRIEAAIGMNHHHCDNCGCEHAHCTCNDDKCSCSDAKDKCTIYCRLNDIEGDLEEHMNILEEHRERLENLEEITTLHEQEINNLKVEDSAIRTLIGEEVTRLDEKIDGNVERLDGRINEANINIASNKAYIQAVEEKLTAEEARSKTVDEQLRNDIDEEVAIRCELSDYVHHVLTENVNENTNEINKHSASLEGHESLLNIHETKLTTLHSDLSEANKELARQYVELTNEDSRLDASIKKNETAINSINKDITERIDRELTSLQNQTTSNTDAISALKEADNDIKNTISEEKNKVVNAQRDISINSAKIDAVEGRLNAAEKDIATNTSNIAAHEKRISDNNGSIITLNDRVTSLEDTKATIVDLAATDTKVEANSTKLSDHDERISDNEESISSLDTSVKNLDAQITSKISEVNSSISSNVATLEGKITESNNKITALQTTVESNKTAVDNATSLLDNRIQSLEANVGTKNDDTTVREHITSLLSTSTDITEQLNAVDKKVDKNAEAIAALETQTINVESDIKTRVDSQTQFIVITSLDAETGIKSISLPKLFEDEAGSSSEWTIVAVTSVAKVNEDNTLEVIYPEIKYVGTDNTEHNGKDEREIQITFNSGKSETVQIAISAFKESNKRVKNIA